MGRREGGVLRRRQEGRGRRGSGVEGGEGRRKGGEGGVLRRR